MVIKKINYYKGVFRKQQSLHKNVNRRIILKVNVFLTTKLAVILLVTILTFLISCQSKETETKPDSLIIIEPNIQIEIIRYWFNPSIKLIELPNSIKELSTPNHQYLHIVLSVKNVGDTDGGWRTESFKIHVKGMISSWYPANAEYTDARLSPIGFPKSNLANDETYVYYGTTGGLIKPGTIDTASVSFVVPKYSTEFILDIEGLESISIHQVKEKLTFPNEVTNHELDTNNLHGEWIFDVNKLDEFFDSMIEMQIQKNNVKKPSITEIEKRKSILYGEIKSGGFPVYTFKKSSTNKILLTMKRSGAAPKQKILTFQKSDNKSLIFTDERINEVRIIFSDKNHITYTPSADGITVGVPYIRK